MKEQELLSRLKSLKLVTEEQIEKANKLKKNVGGSTRTVDILLKMGYIKRADVSAIISDESREILPPIEISGQTIDLEAMGKIPREFVEKHKCVVFEAGKGKILLALASPDDLNAIEDVQFFTGMLVEAGFAPGEKIEMLIKEYYEKPEDERLAARVGGDMLLNADPGQVARAIALLLIRHGVISKTELENELERMRPK
ncbi:MAG: GspE/PulE/PilB domain-containing protein [Planctomycetota bacterium]|jgi:hypothetical protein